MSQPSMQLGLGVSSNLVLSCDRDDLTKPVSALTDFCGRDEFCLRIHQEKFSKVYTVLSK